MPYRLQLDETISLGIRRLLLERVDRIVVDLTDAPRGRDMGVHDARKSCKRIRAAYRLIRDEIGHELYRQENIRFRDAARLLAGERDSWVMIRTLDNLVEAYQDDLPPDAFSGIRQHLREKYETTLAGELENQTTIPAILETMDEARLQIKHLPIVNEDFSAFQHGIRRVYRRGRKGMRLSYSRPSADAFHEWRKRVKYLWYHLEILEALWPNVLSKLADELHTLSNYLGDDHDLAVLRSTVLDVPAGFEDQIELLALVQRIDAARLSLEALAHPLGERLYFDPPKRFVRRLETCWEAWEAEHANSQIKLIQEIQDRSPAYIRLDENLLTTAEMATRLEISPEKVRRLIRDGKLPAEKVGAIWIIKADIDVGSDSFDDGLLSTRKAAGQLDVPLTHIWKMIQSGHLPATKAGRYWVIREADLMRLGDR